MKLRPLFRWLAWPAALGLLGLVLLGAYGLRGFLTGQRTADKAEESATVPKRLQNNVIKIGAQLAESYGVKDEPAQPTQWQRRITVYGRVVPNPRATVEVRAPFAGILRATADGTWPVLGSWVKGGQHLGWLDIRFGPQERLDLMTRLTEARATQKGAEDVLETHQDRMHRFEAAGQSVARADLDQAKVQVSEAKTQLARAADTVKHLADALAEIDRQGDRKEAAWSHRLSAPADGEIAELAARPGMAVEPGALIARVMDSRKPLVRLDIPLVALSTGPPAKVGLAVPTAGPSALAGAGNRPEPEKPTVLVPATLAGTAPQVDAASQSAGYWYEVELLGGFPGAPVGGGIWRPGLFVKGQVPTPDAEPVDAVAVPETALLYHQGRALVYVRLTPGRYERREVRVLGRDGDRWVLASGVSAGERIVSQRAQVLLSEEFRGEADND
jgi:hypothetical protein